MPKHPQFQIGIEQRKLEVRKEAPVQKNLTLYSHFLCKFVKADNSLFEECPSKKQIETFYPTHLFFQPVQDYLLLYFPEILCSIIS